MTGVYVRLAPCPRCASRERLLIDGVGTTTGGQCSDCGEPLADPLATEEVHQDELLLHGRAGKWRVRPPAYQDD
jgi:hypothetical protein